MSKRTVMWLRSLSPTTECMVCGEPAEVFGGRDRAGCPIGLCVEHDTDTYRLEAEAVITTHAEPEDEA